MSRRRISSPLHVQQLWDAVKIIRYKRQVANSERIIKYMTGFHKVPEDEVRRQLDNCVRDGLLKQVKKIVKKGSKVGAEQENYQLPDINSMPVKDSHDWYCFECHLAGDVISCTLCHRVYHLSCISKDDLPDNDVKHKFICYICELIKNKDLTPNIKKSQLNRILKTLVCKLKDRLPIALTDRQVPCNSSYISERFAIQALIKKPSIDVPINFKWVLNDKDDWRVNYLIYKALNINEMESKADSVKYEHLEEFRADVKLLVHNVVIYHGVNSNMADVSRIILRDCSVDLQEILECWLCYKCSNNKSIRNSFCKPCKPPHELVYAKSKGCPYWPAKVLKSNDNIYEVRFFGSHERAVVEKSHIRPISVNIHTLQVKGSSAWNKACEELKRYQKQLEKLRIETDDFTKPFVDSSSSSDSSDNEESHFSDTENVNDKIINDDKKLEIKIPKTDMVVRNKRKLRSETKEELEIIKNTKRGIARRPVYREDSTSSSKSSSWSCNSSLSDEQEFVIKKTKVPNEKRKSTKSNKERIKRKNQSRTAQPKREQSETSDEVIPVKKTRASSYSRVEVDSEMPDIINDNNMIQLERTDNEEYNITSTSGKCQTSTKRNEEEIVSSSSSTQNPLKRSVKVQTKPIESKPNREWVITMEKQFEEEKEHIIASLKEEHEREIEKLKAAHNTILSETKRKQWCVDCEKEAIYHCCWNTSYCSPQCQLAHWGKDHKKHCRRKR